MAAAIDGGGGRGSHSSHLFPGDWAGWGNPPAHLSLLLPLRQSSAPTKPQVDQAEAALKLALLLGQWEKQEEGTGGGRDRKKEEKEGGGV